MEKKTNHLNLSAARRDEIVALLRRYLPNAEVWAYGSRVRGNAQPHSDLDLVAFVTKEQEQAVFELKEAFENSDLPFRVDLFAWDEVPEPFRENIRKGHVVLRKKDAPGEPDHCRAHSSSNEP